MTDGVTDAELRRAKAQLRSGLLMTLESPIARAEPDRQAPPDPRPPAGAGGNGGEGRGRHDRRPRRRGATRHRERPDPCRHRPDRVAAANRRADRRDERPQGGRGLVDMAFLRATTPFESPVISGLGLFLRTPSIADYPAWMELRAESRAFLTPWEPTWPADDLTRTAFRRRVRRYQCGDPRGPRLSLLHLPAVGLRAARRHHAVERHARHDPDRDASATGWASGMPGAAT